MTCISSKYFQKNTIINGTDFSYCKIEDVIESLNSKYDEYHLDVKLRDKTFTINPKDIDLVITAKNDLIKIKDDQNAFLWFTYLFGTNEYTANYQISYSENKTTIILSAGEGTFAGGKKSKTIVSTESKALNTYDEYEEPTNGVYVFSRWVDENGAESTSDLLADNPSMIWEILKSIKN